MAEPNKDQALTMADILPIWWAMAWRGAVVGGIGGLLGGVLLAVILVALGFGPATATQGAIVGWIISIPVSMWAMKAALTAQYYGLEIRIVRR